jgi:hypothetical protein
MRSSPVVLAAAMLPLLSACIFFEGPEARQIEKSPNYKAGYSDGCATVSSKSANYREQNDYRDPTLFKTDKAYRSGWSAGYTGCRPVLGNEEPQNGPVADPYQRR